MHDNDSDEDDGYHPTSVDVKRNLEGKSLVRPFIEPKPHEDRKDNRETRKREDDAHMEKPAESLHVDARTLGYVCFERDRLEISLNSDRRVPLGIRETWTIRNGNQIIEITRSAESVPEVAYRKVGSLQEQVDACKEVRGSKREAVLRTDDRDRTQGSRRDGINPDRVILIEDKIMDEYHNDKGKE